MERDPRPMDDEDDPLPAPGKDAYAQPTGAPHHYLWIFTIGSPETDQLRSPGFESP